eukprot:CAMPEP_0116831376 /NCGR_PEP_ID=MMETSP0418-20121206/5302_1 /TAXON_ID=1158023 /ORGANISM="Astrosyne radiata, Strain 13vi08-1A" /LENGTH=143 /DNA_ID=CAMNT_0004460619 /DNA_START=589 /DNA_END=1020 /DNA_ORIENTATION=-
MRFGRKKIAPSVHTHTPTNVKQCHREGKGSRRRMEGGFLGAKHILGEGGKFKKQTRKRVGIMGMKAPTRQGAVLKDAETDAVVGQVTSGTYSPSLKAPIAMGYVETAYSKVGTNVAVEVRGKQQPATIAKMPFVESRYYRVPE